ncbi:RtcB family protein [Cellulomonas sp. NPDC057328]|uniref:RtcB family protein n=1 Tax=Cellulomonas sp. NPDC057328 TaxID=3346101 RepID=UPI00362A4935
MWLFLHSGSRGVGNRLAQHHIRVAADVCCRRGVELPDRDPRTSRRARTSSTTRARAALGPGLCQTTLRGTSCASSRMVTATAAVPPAPSVTASRSSDARRRGVLTPAAARDLLRWTTSRHTSRHHGSGCGRAPSSADRQPNDHIAPAD